MGAVGDEELVRRLEMLPARVHLVAATVVDATIGKSPSTAVCDLVGPAVRRILQISEQFSLELQETNHA